MSAQLTRELLTPRKFGFRLFSRLYASGFVSNSQNHGKSHRVGRNLQIEVYQAVDQQTQRASYATQKDGATITPLIPEKGDGHPHQEIKNGNEKKDEPDQACFRRKLQIIVVGMIHRQIDKMGLERAQGIFIRTQPGAKKRIMAKKLYRVAPHHSSL